MSKDTKALIEEIDDLLNGCWAGDASNYINHVDNILERAQGALKAQGWCPDCNGSGEVLGEMRHTPDPQDAYTSEVPCPRCNGTGDKTSQPPDWLTPILLELEKATTKFPTWPTDPLHALGVLGEEFGELGKEVLQMVYEPHKTSLDEIRKESIQTAAMALRFFASLDAYEYTPRHQHQQAVLSSKKAAA